MHASARGVGISDTDNRLARSGYRPVSHRIRPVNDLDELASPACRVPTGSVRSIPRDVAYLNAAYMGPLSHAVIEAGNAGLARKTQPWTVTAPDFFEPVDEVRELFARLIGRDADGVAVLPSVSYGVVDRRAQPPSHDADRRSSCSRSSSRRTCMRGTTSQRSEERRS